jgi:hypothetical protein
MSILQKLYLRTNSHILKSNLLSQRRRLYSSKPNESIPNLNKSSPIRSLYFKSVIIWIIFGSVSLQLQWVKMEVNQLEEKFKVESLLLKDQIEKIDKDSEQENSNKELDLGKKSNLIYFSCLFNYYR